MGKLVARGASRRDFLRLAAGAAAVAAGGVACASGSDKPKAGSTAASGPKGRQTLRIVQWSHFVPAYDAWFDEDFVRRWGEEHDVEVVVDHIDFNDLPLRADTEVSGGRGHDIFGFLFPAACRFQEHVIDHREIVEEVQAKAGRMHPFVERSILNPKTGKYYGFSDFWTSSLVHYRTDLWNGIRPGRYEDTLQAGPGLKAGGHPLGFSLGEADPDANCSLMGLLHAYGASIQDESANVSINSPAAVEAVRVMAAVYQAGMTDETLTWDGASNNRYLANGTGSLILNPISAVRAIEKQDPELAAKVGLLPPPAGPAGNQGPYVIGTYVIWKFARNPEVAKQFLVDLALASRDGLIHSEYYNLPSFPGVVPDLAAVLGADAVAQPPDKYAVLAEADEWTTNMGFPGSANVAVQDVFDERIITRMFAAAVGGQLSPEEAVKAAEAEIRPIFDLWKERGQI
ncbi:MAG: ABC transporter substrate-binding protein [Acidimicrobiia bacterium]